MIPSFLVNFVTNNDCFCNSFCGGQIAVVFIFEIMKSIHIINGPNLNRLGVREPELYGNTPFEEYLERLRDLYSSFDIIYFQSNHEGDIIDYLQSEEIYESIGVVLNAGALSHYSYALADCIRSISIPIVEVHISQLSTREPHRHLTVLTEACTGMIMGLGLDVYRLAIAHLIARR